jgi:hypothetical protein
MKRASGILNDGAQAQMTPTVDSTWVHMTEVPVAQVKSLANVALKLRLIRRTMLVIHTLPGVRRVRN